MLLHHQRKKRKEKTTPFGVDVMKNQVLYRAAQVTRAKSETPVHDSTLNPEQHHSPGQCLWNSPVLLHHQGKSETPVHD